LILLKAIVLLICKPYPEQLGDMNNRFLILNTSLFLLLTPGIDRTSVALPPPEDTPEEVLRTEIITEARSPIDGKPLTAAEYAQLKTKLAQNSFPSEVNSNVKETIFLLNIRKLFKTLTPF
jgi:hypothetical protein